MDENELLAAFDERRAAAGPPMRSPEPAPEDYLDDITWED